MNDSSGKPRPPTTLRIPALRNELPLDLGALVSPLVASAPDYVGSPLAAEQLPVLFWLSESLRPRVVVDVGAMDPTVYFAICQALGALSVDARCFLSDLVPGVPNIAGESPAELWVRYQNEHHPRHSRIVTGDTGDLLEELGDATVDLLVLHLEHAGEEQVRRWQTELLPKLASDGVIFADGLGSTYCGIYDELALAGPAFRFQHGSGFAVIAPGPTPPAQVKYLGNQNGSAANAATIRAIYQRLGSGYRELTSSWERALEDSSGSWAAQLVNCEAKIEDLNRQLEWHREELEHVGDQAQKAFESPGPEDELMAGLLEAQRNLKASRTEIGALRQAHDDAIAQLSRSSEERLARLRDEFSARKAALQSEIHHLEAGITTLKGELHKTAADAEKTNSKLLQELVEITRVSEEWRSRASSLQTDVGRQRGQIADLGAEIESIRKGYHGEKNILLNELVEITRISEEWRSRADLRKSEAEELLLTVQMQRRARDRASKRFQRQVRKLAKELDCARSEAETWKRAAVTLEGQIGDLLSSTSWKATRPLRALKRMFSRPA